MTFGEFIQSGEIGSWLVGAAGAAAAATVDWRSWGRLAQHILVGALAARYATPAFYPAISTALGWVSVDPAAHSEVAGFVTGGFAIYIYEYAIALFRHRNRKQGDADV